MSTSYGGVIRIRFGGFWLRVSQSQSLGRGALLSGSRVDRERGDVKEGGGIPGAALVPR